MDKEWRDIPEYEGLYKVSSIGEVLSLYTGKILRPSRTKDGYKQFILYKNGKAKNMLAHRAVALAFIPCDNHELVVNHIDENKENCSVENLEWVTITANTQYGGNKAMIASVKKFSKHFYVYDKGLNLIGEFVGINKFARENNLHDGNICTALRKNEEKGRKRLATVSGLVFSYHLIEKSNSNCKCG